MCGIVGYIGNKKCIPILIAGLKALEYRGYDSAGIAYFNSGDIAIKKVVGKVENLEKVINVNINSNLGIAHTRWATNGIPDVINAHPHRVGKIILVHNGIIENATELKNSINYDFKSETDTEVIAYILNDLYEKTGNMIESLTECRDILKGSYALGVIASDDINTLYAVKNGSPLIIGVGEHSNYIASDIPAIVKYTDKYIIMEDNEVASIKEDKVSIYKNGLPITKEIKTSNINVESASISGYNHFMLKEIEEQPSTLYKTIEKYIENGKIKEELFPDFSKYDSIELVGCGSAYHTGCVAKTLFMEQSDIYAEAFIASEYRYSNNKHFGNPLVIFISQSGETADTLASLRKIKEEGIDTLAIVNVKESSIAREADNVIYIEVGIEVAVATTKAYTAQLEIMGLIAIIIAKNNKKISDVNFEINELISLKDKVDLILKNVDSIKEIAKKIYKSNDVFFIGRKIDYSICLEGSLKFKEISYIHSEAYPAGELKHGTISLIEDDMPVISVITDESVALKTISNIKETLARGAFSILFTTLNISNEDKLYKYMIHIPKTSVFLTPILVVIYLQLLSYYVADNKGCNIDKPKNLAKSVTVE